MWRKSLAWVCASDEELCVDLLLLEHKQAFTDARDDDHTALEIGIVAPGAATCLVRCRVEEAYLHGILRIGNIEDTESAAIVGLVHQVALDIQVMVRCRGFGDVFLDQDGIIQIGKVPDQRSRAFDQSLWLV